jgi:hypothetical protein
VDYVLKKRVVVRVAAGMPTPLAEEVSHHGASAARGCVEGHHKARALRQHRPNAPHLPLDKFFLSFLRFLFLFFVGCSAPNERNPILRKLIGKEDNRGRAATDTVPLVLVWIEEETARFLKREGGGNIYLAHIFWTRIY